MATDRSRGGGGSRSGGAISSAGGEAAAPGKAKLARGQAPSPGAAQKAPSQASSSASTRFQRISCRRVQAGSRAPGAAQSAVCVSGGAGGARDSCPESTVISGAGGVVISSSSGAAGGGVSGAAEAARRRGRARFWDEESLCGLRDIGFSPQEAFAISGGAQEAAPALRLCSASGKTVKAPTGAQTPHGRGIPRVIPEHTL